MLKAITNWADLPLAQVETLVKALEQVQTSAEFAAVREAAKRVCNILKKATTVTAEPDEKLFETQAERNLFATAKNLSADTQNKLSALKALEVFKAPLEQFFTEVMVNVSDERIRTNRLMLLTFVRQKLMHTADITQL